MQTKSVVLILSVMAAYNIFGERIEIKNESGYPAAITIFYTGSKGWFWDTKGADPKEWWWRIENGKTFNRNEEGGKGYENLKIIFQPYDSTGLQQPNDTKPHKDWQSKKIGDRILSDEFKKDDFFRADFIRENNGNFKFAGRTGSGPIYNNRGCNEKECFIKILNDSNNEIKIERNGEPGQIDTIRPQEERIIYTPKVEGSLVTHGGSYFTVFIYNEKTGMFEDAYRFQNFDRDSIGREPSQDITRVSIKNVEKKWDNGNVHGKIRYGSWEMSLTKAQKARVRYKLASLANKGVNEAR